MIFIPTWVVILGCVAVVLVLLGIWLSGTAQRLNRLHIRTDAARLSLEGALISRGQVIKALHPELACRIAAVERFPLKATDMSNRSDAENGILGDLPEDLLRNLVFVEASARVDLAARFYNDAVADTRALRSRMDVRLARLAGSAPLPEFYEAFSPQLPPAG